RGLAPQAVLEILEQVCRALVAIHGAGLVHRDLSARNVMVSVREGAPVVKVLDFGIAKAAALVARNGQVEAGAEPPGFANPVFSAPEHLAGKPVDARADLYSLGVIGYLLLAGTLPVAAHEPGEAARATVEGRLRPLPKQTGVGRRLGRLIDRCLQRDPDLRPASASEVLRELARIRMAPHKRTRLGWFALAAAVAAMLSTFLFAGKVYLRPVVGSPFERFWQNRAQVLHAQSKDLASLHFDCGDFAIDRLRVAVSRDGASLANYYLDAVPDRSRGQLVLSRAQSGWSDALAGIARASAEGSPVDLQFWVPGQPPLGGVRLLMDDVPPALEWKLFPVREDGGAWLYADSYLQYRITDAGGISAAGLKLRFENEHGPEIEIDLPVAGNRLDLGHVLATRLPGVFDRGSGRLAPWAKDLAGNLCEPEARTFDHCDVAAPLVEAVNGVAGEAVVVNYTGPEVSLRLRLSDHESDLVITAISPDERPQELVDLRPDGPGLLATLRAREDLQPFLSGQYAFEVVDRAGNRSRTTWQLLFRNRRLDDVLQPGPGEKNKALQVGNELALAPGERKLEFRCNEA
ncbi:MAG TPA: protein kinase, partial [Acetobacteraceae bacterium]|nr:protein kinase [Acetobacteraceae bacterium]